MNSQAVSRLLEGLEITAAGGYIGSKERGLGAIIAWGDTVPADASEGYAPGCVFYHVDGGAGTAKYTNEGTKASSDFDADTVA